MLHESLLQINPGLAIPLSEITFRTSRSGGPGGQNVNKVETKVEVLFDVTHSPSLNNSQRIAILEQLKERIDSFGVLRVMAQRTRSQYQNKELALDRLVQLLRSVFKSKKKRIQTKPTSASRRNRLMLKRRLSEKKRMRTTRLDKEG